MNKLFLSLQMEVGSKQKFEAVVLPQVLIGAVLQLAHEGLGHNETLNENCLID